MKKIKLLLLLILVLSCSMNVYAADWMQSPIVSDVEDIEWDRDGDGQLNAKEQAIKDAYESKEEAPDETFGSEEAMKDIVAGSSAGILNTICFLTGTLLLLSSVTISILYLADYVTDGKYCILSFITKRKFRYEDEKLIPFLCKMLGVSVFGIFIANGTFQHWLSNLYASILEYLN